MTYQVGGHVAPEGALGLEAGLEQCSLVIVQVHQKLILIEPESPGLNTPQSGITFGATF